MSDVKDEFGSDISSSASENQSTFDVECILDDRRGANGNVSDATQLFLWFQLVTIFAVLELIDSLSCVSPADINFSKFNFDMFSENFTIFIPRTFAWLLRFSFFLCLQYEYYVKWQGFPSTSNTWEPACNFLSLAMIREYHEKKRIENHLSEQEKKKISRRKSVSVRCSYGNSDIECLSRSLLL